MSRDDVITRIRYRWGLTGDPERVEMLPLVELRGAEVPEEIALAVRELRIEELAGVRGDPSLGSPVEVDDLAVEAGGRETRIRVYNRGIQLILSDDEELIRIHRLCCLLQPLLPKPEGTRVQAQAMRSR